MRKLLFRGLPVLALLFTAEIAGAAATIVIVNADGPGEGFNDPTPVAPVGGNPGTTRGQQRLNVFQRAADTWGATLTSAVVIQVQATFDPLACNSTSAVLGSAGPYDAYANFANAEFSNTWYHVAEASRWAGSDLGSGTPDIVARFNSTLDGNASCLGGIGWYYGYDGNEGSQIDLLPVVLHELGHGLGFSTLVNLSTGLLAGGLPDMYSRNIRDLTTNKLWTQMNNSERIASAVNTGNVVWDGPAVRGHAPAFLGLQPILVVNSPAGIAGTTLGAYASFGGALTTGGLTGDVVLADDGAAPTSDACSPLVNAAQVAGKICLIDRGTCTFTSKVKTAQDAGAIGVIIANNTTGLPQPGGSDPTITIPVIGVSQATGNSIKAQLGVGVNATMKLDPTRLAGADPQNRVLLYTPNPLEIGSSISHWDVTCSPNMLMEPAINSDLGAGQFDLTQYQFEDIGWFGPTTDIANVAPRATRLLSNVPNPFNPSTTIQFELARDGAVRLEVYSLSGRLVKRLVDRGMQPGVHSAAWDGTNDNGHRVASGVYVYRLKAGGTVDSRRMVLLK